MVIILSICMHQFGRIIVKKILFFYWPNEFYSYNNKMNTMKYQVHSTNGITAAQLPNRQDPEDQCLTNYQVDS